MLVQAYHWSLLTALVFSIGVKHACWCYVVLDSLPAPLCGFVSLVLSGFYEEVEGGGIHRLVWTWYLFCCHTSAATFKKRMNESERQCSFVHRQRLGYSVMDCDAIFGRWLIIKYKTLKFIQGVQCSEQKSQCCAKHYKPLNSTLNPEPLNP